MGSFTESANSQDVFWQTEGVRTVKMMVRARDAGGSEPAKVALG